MSASKRPADGAMTLAEIKEFAGFSAATQRYVRRSLDVGLEREDALSRWSRDTGMQLSYQLPSDYTLYKRVSDLHTTDIQSATAELSSIYASQGVSVSADERQILVQAAGGSVGAPADAPNSPAPSAPSAK